MKYPEGGSGTGYAQYRVFKITYNDNRFIMINWISVDYDFMPDYNTQVLVAYKTTQIIGVLLQDLFNIIE